MLKNNLFRIKKRSYFGLPGFVTTNDAGKCPNVSLKIPAFVATAKFVKRDSKVKTLAQNHGFCERIQSPFIHELTESAVVTDVYQLKL